MSLLEVEKAVLPHIYFVLPALYVVCSFLLSRFLRFSFAFVLFLGAFPYLLQRFELPFSELVETQHPLVLTACLWGVVSAVLLGLAAARLFGAALKASSRALGVVLWIGACAALAAATLLIVNPSFLNAQVPNWKGAYGVVLFGFAATACCIALLKFARASAFIAVWGVVCVILGAELFFNTLPSELLDKALTSNDGLVALNAQSVPGGADSLLEDENSLKIAVLGSSSLSSTGYAEQISYPAVLERLLNSSATEPGFSVDNYSEPGNSIVQIRNFVNDGAFANKPDIALISSWFEDSKKALNSFGIAGLNELEAYEKLGTEKWLASLPTLSRVFNSKTYKAAKLFVAGRANEDDQENPVRVPLEDYSEMMKQTLASLKEKEITPVIVHEPVEAGLTESSQEYLQAALKAANELEVPVIMLKDVLEKYGRDKLFLEENKLSAEGHQVVGESLFEALGIIAEKLNLPETTRTAFNDASSFPAKRFVQTFPTAEIGDEVVFNVALPPARTGYYKASFSVNNIPVKTKKLNTPGRVELSFPFPESARTSPFAALSLQLSPSHGLSSDYIGSKNIPVPAKLLVSAAEGSNLVVSNNLETAANENGIIARINPKNGAVERSMPIQAGSEEVSRFIKSTPWGHLIAIAASDASKLSQFASAGSFNYIGVKNPAMTAKPVAVVGVAGAKVSQIMAQPNFAKLQFGSKKFSRFSRMRVKSVSSGGKRLF